MTTQHSKLFESSSLKDLDIPNKLVVAPMTRVSAQPDGTVGPLMQDYYEDFAKGGFGLIVTEGLYTDECYSQGYRGQPGMVTSAHAKSWEPIVEGVHAKGAFIVAQLMHAGALSQYNAFSEKTAAPSALQPLGEQMPFYGGNGPYPVPQAMSKDDIGQAIRGFAKAALQAKLAGFDGVEIHGANGYLLDQFLTDYTNERADHYGGSVSNQLRIYQEVVEAVRAEVGNDFIVGIRFSQKKVNDTEHFWSEGEAKAETAFALMRDSGVDYIHTTEPVLDEAAFEGSASLASLAKKYSGLPVIANGGVHEPELATRMIESGQSDFIALGKVALSNPDWPKVVQNQGTLTPFDFGILSPQANLENAKRYFQK